MDGARKESGDKKRETDRTYSTSQQATGNSS